VTALTMRLVGGGLLTLAGALFGWEKNAQMRETLRCLRTLGRALGRLQAELTALQTPLPQLFSALGAECALFAMVSARFGTQPVETLWCAAVKTLPLGRNDAQALEALGAVLGRYDAARQAAETALVRDRLCVSADALEREIQERGRRFAGLGAALGAMAAVLLF